MDAWTGLPEVHFQKWGTRGARETAASVLALLPEQVMAHLWQVSGSWLKRQCRGVLDRFCTFLALGALLLDTGVGFCVLVLTSRHKLNTPGMT